MNEITPASTEPIALSDEEKSLIKKELTNVREEMHDDPYIAEALRVLASRGLRSAIGSYWNAVVDDLRNKIMHRSLDLFNKEMQPKREIKKYEDFQDHTTEHDLIEGAYKIGVISWEARKVLHQVRENRNIFYGHPKSSEPTVIKVVSIISDCNTYVLSQDYPPAIIDISTYLSQMDNPNYDRNSFAAEQAFCDLPSVYKGELINRFLATYITDSISTILRSNIEFCAPILWQNLTKEDRKQIGKRFDKLVVEGDKDKISKALDFLKLVGGMMYVTSATRKVIFGPLIEELEQNLDQWAEEERIVKELKDIGTNIPSELIQRYVAALTLTFVGHRGYSMNFNRKDFYSDGASPHIQELFRAFDNESVDAFVSTIKENEKLKRRISEQGQLNRLRILANILLEKGGFKEESEYFLELISDETRRNELADALKRDNKAVQRTPKRRR